MWAMGTAVDNLFASVIVLDDTSALGFIDGILRSLSSYAKDKGSS